MPLPDLLDKSFFLIIEGFELIAEVLKKTTKMFDITYDKAHKMISFSFLQIFVRPSCSSPLTLSY